MGSINRVFNDEMYVDCAQFTIIDKSAEGECELFITAGAVSALFTLPTVIIGITLTCILCTGLFLVVKRSAKQHRFTLLICVVEIFFMLQFGVSHLFYSRGMAWLGKTGTYVQTTNDLKCKAVSFYNAFLHSTIANLIFVEALNRALSLKARGYITPISQKSIMVIIICFVLGIVTAIPIFITYGVWRVDGRSICSADPTWAKTIVLWITGHNFLLINGFVQCVLVIILNIISATFVGRLDNSINYLSTTLHLPNAVTDSLHEIIYLMRESRRDTYVCILHSSLVGFFLLLLSIMQLIFSSELFWDLDDNGLVAGTIGLYYQSAIIDILYFTIIFIMANHFWMYYALIPAFSAWLFKISPHEASVGTKKYLEIISPVDPDGDEFRVHWHQVAYLTDQYDPNMYTRLRKLEKEVVAFQPVVPAMPAFNMRNK